MVELIHFEDLAAVEVLAALKSYKRAGERLGITRSLLKRKSSISKHS